MFKFATIARPYAKAAFDFAVEHKTIEHWQKMLVFSALITCNAQIDKLLSDAVAPEILFKIFNVVLGDQIDVYGRNFLRIMAENRRLLALPAVLHQFIKLRASLDSTVEVEVRSIRELSKEQQSQIIIAMEKRLSRKVKLNCKIDKSILAGIIICAEDMVIDGSVRSRLERLADALQS